MIIRNVDNECRVSLFSHNTGVKVQNKREKFDSTINIILACVSFQVQFQEETLEENQAGSVNLRLFGSSTPWCLQDLVQVQLFIVTLRCKDGAELSRV